MALLLHVHAYSGRGCLVQLPCWLQLPFSPIQWHLLQLHPVVGFKFPGPPPPREPDASPPSSITAEDEVPWPVAVPVGFDRPRRRSEILPPLVPTLSTDCRLKSPSMSPFRLPFAPFGILVRPVSIPSVSSPFGGGFSRPSCLVLSNPHVPPSQHHTNAVQTSTTHVLEGASIPHARTAATSQDKGGTHLLWQGRNWPEADAQEGPATRGFDGTRTPSQVAYEENDRIHGQSMLEGVQRGGACVTLRDWTGKETCDGEGRLRSHGTVLESIRLGSSFFRFRS